MSKSNCWEYKHCHKEDCPAKGEAKLDGVHGGVNAGRACWMVAGTRCQGVVQGTFANKIRNYMECDFYISVRDAEGKMFLPGTSLLLKLGGDND